MTYRQRVRPLISEALDKINIAQSMYVESDVEYQRIEKLRVELSSLSTAALKMDSTEDFEAFKEFYDGLEDLLEKVGDS